MSRLLVSSCIRKLPLHSLKLLLNCVVFPFLLTFSTSFVQYKQFIELFECLAVDLSSNFAHSRISLLLCNTYGNVYTGPDPSGASTKLVPISLVFARDLVDPVRIGSAIWYQMGPFMVILCGTVPFQFRTCPV